MFGSKARREQAAHYEAQAEYWDGQAAECDRQIKELQQHRTGDPEAVAFGTRRLQAERSTAEYNAAGYRSA